MGVSETREGSVRPGTLVALLRQRAVEDAGKRIYTFLLDGEDEESTLTYGELDRQARAIAARLQSLDAAGERALLLYPPGLEFIAAYFGCLYAGVIAVPAFPPRLNRPSPRVERIVTDAGARLALTTTAVLEKLQRRFEHMPALASLQWLNSDQIDEELAAQWIDPQVESGTLAFLQYTSGSTSAPKGVMVSHGNLMHNLAMIKTGFQIDTQARGVFWLPSYHDMGLIGGILEPMYVNGHSLLMAPAAFLQRPARWLQALSRDRGTISGAPNFAYQMAVDKVTEAQCEGLDLSAWSIAFCGAEPIRDQTLAQFAAKFAPYGFRPDAFYPCYGLAEGTLLVAGGNGPAPPTTLTIRTAPLAADRAELAAAVEPGTQTVVSCGQTLLDQEIVIAGPETHERLGSNQVGEIWVSGPSVAQGYWNRPQLTQATFGAYLASGEGPFLRTGDLGFQHEGQLYVSGRLKDLIIIRGRNHYPQDIEATVAESHPAFETGMGAAFAVSVEGQEQLVVAYELKRSHRRASVAEVTAAARAAIAANHGLQVHAILLLKPLSIPKTSSGKIKRHACRAGFLDGGLEVVGEWRAESGQEMTDDGRQTADGNASTHPTIQRFNHTISTLHSLISHLLSTRLKIAPEQVDMQRPFVDYGLDSVQAVELMGELETVLGRPLSPTLVWDYPNVAALAGYLAQSEEQAATGLIRSVEQPAREPVAVIGVGCRFPGADGPEQFWQLLRDGVDAISEVPVDRWNMDEFYGAGEDGPTPGKMNTRWGGFLADVDQFDPHFFGISPREAQRMDPQQRLLLEVASEALERAGQRPSRLAGTRTGVFVGISSYDYSRLQFSDPAQIDAYAGTGNAHSIAANRLSYLLDLRGPSMAVDTACSSSLVATHLAIQSLRSGESDLALAGGVNLLLAPELSITFSQARMMAADGRCKTFDARADGYVRGEGAGVVVLKRLSDAVRDGDPILALLHGSAVNQDGRSNGLTAPNGPAQQAVIRRALADAGATPSQLSYIEAHGTGTPLGDPIEVQSLRAVLEEEDDAPGSCFLGSVKTNVGHLEAAAGVAGLIKVILSLQAQEIPAHLHFQELNSYISLDGSALRIPTEPQPWPHGAQPRLAGVSSFGFGGTNAHVIVGDWQPVLEEREIRKEFVSDWPYILPLSAKSEPALAALAPRYEKYLQSAPDQLLPAICHTSATGRDHFEQRAAVTGHDRDALLQQLGNFQPAPVKSRTPRLAFLFTGQGSQYAGMARGLYESQPLFRATLDHCAQILEGELDRPLLDIIFAENPISNAPVSNAQATEALKRPLRTIHETVYTQPALFAVEYALAQLWRSWGVLPDLLLGHSVGEYVAACLAGVFSLEDGLRLVAARGRLMQALPHGGSMAVIFAGREEVRRVLQPLDGSIAVAAFNGPQNVTISGTEQAVSSALAAFEGQGLEVRSLTVSHAFHSPLMAPMLDQFEAIAGAIAFQAPRMPLVSNVSGRLFAAGEVPDAAYWRQHVRQPVDFAAGVQALAAEGANVFLEIGPQPHLLPLVSRILQSSAARENGAAPILALPSLRRHEAEAQTMTDSLATLYTAGVELDWDGVYAGRRQRRVALPTYPFQRQRYWLDIAPAPQRATTSGNSVTRMDTALPLYEAVYRPQTYGNFAAFLQDTLKAVARDFWGGEGHGVQLGTIPAPSLETTVALQIALWPLSAEQLTCQLFTRLEGQGWQPAGSASLERAGGDDGRQTMDGGRGLQTAVTSQPTTDPTIQPTNHIQFTDHGSHITVHPAVNDLPSAVDFLRPHAAQVLGLLPERLDPRRSLDTLGMDSLMAIELRNRIEGELGVTLPVVALLEGASVEQLAEKLLIYLEEAPDGRLPIVAGEHVPETPFPLSYGQQAMWFLHQLLPEDIAFNVAGAVRLRGVLDVAALRRAWRRLLQRHPALRTAFISSTAGPLQVVREGIVPELRLVDAGQWSEDAVSTYLQQEAYRPFDLEQGAPLRLVLLRRAPEEHILLLSVNHIVADFWSMALLVRELSLFYVTERSGVGVHLPAPAIHYGDYVAWQQKLLQSEQGARLHDYWVQQLSGELPLLDLPTDRPRPAQQTFHGDTASRLLDPQLARRVQALAQSQGATLATTLLAAFQALLQRYSGQEQVLVGSVFSGREQPELADLVGYLINPVALRADFSEPLSFSQLLQQVRKTMLDAFAHQNYPLPLLAEQLPLQRDPGRPPLFETMFIMQKAQVMEEQGLNALALGMPGARLELEGLAIESLALGGLPAQFDLTLMMAEVPDGLAASLHYNTALFDRQTAERMLAHLEMMLDGVTAQPDTPLAQLPLLSTSERHQILEEWNRTRVAHSETGCLQHLIEAQAERALQAPAAHCGSQTLTYEQLNRRANRLAHALQGRGVGPETLVAIAVERSLEMLVAVLGVLKAGGAYVPLDPAFPAARLQLMLEDARPPVLLTQASLLEQLPATQADVICLDRDWEALIEGQPDHNPQSGVSPDNLAYVIYTSGSTGRPKGVQIEHRAVTNFLNSMRRQPGLAAEDVLLAVTTLSFDIAVLELYLPLLVGAQAVIAPAETASDAARLIALMEAAGATVMQATPATWRLLLEAGWSGQEGLKILCGGEALTSALARELLPRCGELWNMYGPTETTVWSAIHRVTDGDNPVPIGRPIANTTIYILDEALQPVPTGVAGDLYIGGDGLARGYLNRPELTAQRFVTVHGLQETDARQRLYKTGDLARYRPDGAILYLGRRDQQVKVRGYRIELGDVEAALARHPLLQQSVVVARSTAPGDDAAKQLVAYVVAADGQTAPDGGELRRFLRQNLPDYMLPAAFVPLDALPLTPNNKVDRRALPEPPQIRPVTAVPYVAPRTPLEEELVALCSEVLGMEADATGVNDDFFDLGGNSLLATRLIFQVRERYQVQIPLRHLFARPTIAGLAEAVEAVREGSLAGDDGQWHMTVEALKAEAVLDADIDSGGRSYRPVARLQHVLLTGATGFVGAFLLRDLLMETEATVHYLVRAGDPESGAARLRRNLEQYGLWQEEFAARIVPLPGDLAQLRLGLEAEQFRRLAREMDAIYHNGALVNFVYPYSAHKAANVLGTQELLRLAARERLKPLHFVSTLSVFHTGEHDGGTVFAEEDDLEETGAPFGGYAQSKWVAEKLVQEAGARGIPVVIYRPGLVSGDSQSGAWNTDDMMTTLARISLALGAVPLLDAGKKLTQVDLVPVDYVSAAIVHLSQQPASLGHTFHLSNARPLPYAELLSWLDRWAVAAGMNIEMLPFTEWRQQLVQLALQAGGSEANPFLPLIEEVSAEQVFMPAIDCTNTEGALAGSGIICAPVDSKLLQTYLAHFAEKGLVPAASAAATAE